MLASAIQIACTNPRLQMRAIHVILLRSSGLPAVNTGSRTARCRFVLRTSNETMPISHILQRSREQENGFVRGCKSPCVILRQRVTTSRTHGQNSNRQRTDTRM